MNIDSWFVSLANENRAIDPWKREERARQLLDLFSPIALDQLITTFKKSPATKPIKKLIVAELRARSREYDALLNQGELPQVVISKLVGKDVPTAVFERVSKLIHMQVFPWLVAWKMGFTPPVNGRFRIHEAVSEKMQVHIAELVEQDGRHAKVIYQLLSTQNQPDFATLQRVKQLFVSECAFLDAEKPQWLCWHQLVMQWLRHKGTPVEAKTRTEQLYRAFSQISFEKPVPVFTPIDLPSLVDTKATFQEYVVQYSLYKIFDHLKIQPSKHIQEKLAKYFTSNDTARKFALYFAIELSNRGCSAVADIKTVPLVIDVLHKFVEASDLCFYISNGKRYFELFFNAEDSGRAFFLKNWSQGITPIVPMKFKEAFDAIEKLTDAFTFLEQEKLLLVSRIALLSEPLIVETIVRKYFAGQKDVGPFLTRFLDECNSAFQNPYLFSYDDFVTCYEEQKIDCFTALDCVKRCYFTLHKMAQGPVPDLIVAGSVEEGAFVDAWLFAKTKPGFARQLLGDVEDMLKTTLSNEDRILFFAHASAFGLFEYSNILGQDIANFLGSIEGYKFRALQKALLLYEFFRVPMKPYRLFIDGFEALLGHKLPSLTAFTILLLHSIPKKLLKVYEQYSEFKMAIQLIPNKQLGVPGELIEQIRDVEVTLHSTCYLPIAKQGYIDIDGCYGGTIVNFARLTLCSPSRTPEAAAFVHQPFFPHDVPTKQQEGSELLVPLFPDLSMVYSYVWEETRNGYLYHLKIQKNGMERLLDVELPITRAAFEHDSNLAEVIHWVLLIVSEESTGYETTPDFVSDAIEAKTMMTKLIGMLESSNAELIQFNQQNGLDRRHQLHLPWDEAMWQHVSCAYVFVRNLRVGVRKILSSAW